MYSINVFLTFTLSQLGMCKHWWDVRKAQPDWRRKLSINGVGLIIDDTILTITVSTQVCRRRVGYIVGYALFHFRLLDRARALRPGPRCPEKPGRHASHYSLPAGLEGAGATERRDAPTAALSCAISTASASMRC